MARTIASLTIITVGALTACADDEADGITAEATRETPPVTTEPPESAATTVADVPSTTEATRPTTGSTGVDTADPPSSTAPPTTATTTAPPGESLCVEAPELVLPTAVEPDAAQLVFSTDPAAGRYRSEQLGVALAFDVADSFVDVVWRGDSLLLVGPYDEETGASPRIGIARPTTYLAGGLDDEPREVDLETWLTETGVEILSDGTVDVAGHAGREIVLRAPGEPYEPGVISEENRGVAFAKGLAMDPSGDATERLIVVDVEDPTPLVFLVHLPAGDTGFDATAQAFIDGVVIGEAEPAPGVALADTPWNRDWGAQTLLGPCILPAIAFGGLEVGLSQPVLAAGEGNELWFAPASEEFSGFAAPRVFVQQPTAIADGGCCRGDAVADAAGVVAAYSDAGYELTELDGRDVTVFGSPARTFEFTSPDGIGFWPSDHEASSGTGLSSLLSGGRSGVFHVADTELGPLLVQMDAEVGTDDLAMVEPILADLLTSMS